MSKLQRYRTCNYSEFDTHSEGEWVKAEDAIKLEDYIGRLEIVIGAIALFVEAPHREQVRKIILNVMEGK